MEKYSATDAQKGGLQRRQKKVLKLRESVIGVRYVLRDLGGLLLKWSRLLLKFSYREIINWRMILLNGIAGMSRISTMY